MLRRIERRGRTEHVDLFDYILPADHPLPSDRREVIHIGALAQQMMFANYALCPTGIMVPSYFYLKSAECLQRLSKEIRDKFESYCDIMPSALACLPFLHACLEESQRLLPSDNTGLPRLSPGAIIDGHYIPKGVSCLFHFTGLTWAASPLIKC